MALSNSRYNAIMREYDSQRAKNRHELNRRIDEVYEKVPEMRELDTKAGASALERVKKYIKEGNKSSLDGYSGEVEEIAKKKRALLLANGFSEDYMQERYACKDCKDTGYSDRKKCHCFKEKIVKFLYEKSNINKLDDKAGFKYFSLEYYDNKRVITNLGKTVSEYMNDIFEFCKRYVDNFENKKDNIIFTGTTGVGKTFLSASIAKELLDRCYSVMYFTATDFFSETAKAKLDKEQDLDGLYELIKDSDLLIIDDLGTELGNTWTSSQLFYIMDYRMRNNKATIMSTNFSTNMLKETYSERVVSRLIDAYDFIHLYGEDLRIKRNI